MPDNLPWPPRKEDLVRLYLVEGLSAAKIAKAYGLKYASPKTAESTVLYHLKKNGVQRRASTDHLDRITENLVDAWIQRYKSGESLSQIAGDTYSPTSVMLHLKRRGVERRAKVEAQIRAVSKHIRLPFDDDNRERAYLIGFSIGDLNVSTHGRAVRIKTATTHPRMVELIVSLFQRHGHVLLTPRKSSLAGFEWSVQCDLDSSFGFLLEASRSLPGWVFDDDNFPSFTAGLFDAEGSIWFNRSSNLFELSITNSNKEMLEGVSRGLNKLSLFPHLGFSKGSSVWKLQLWRPAEVHRFLSLLPVRHPEKLVKARLVLESEGSTRSAFNRVVESWDSAIAGIKKDRDNFVEQAKQRLSKSAMS